MRLNSLRGTEDNLAGESDEEFSLSEKDFRYIAQLIGQRAGIVIGQVKRPLVYGRLVRRLRVLGLTSFSDYCKIIADENHEESEHFVNALTTNLTSFYREPKHFDYLENVLLPRLLKDKPNKQLRIWSAGCSTGEEPYSLAISVASVVPESWDVKILATDLDSQVLARASAGVYAIDRLGGISNERKRHWFMRGSGDSDGLCRVRSDLKDMITFRPLNLLNDWPLRNKFDIIFCRNVVIYFDKPTQKKLFDRFADQLIDDGHLFIGHSETLFKTSERFELLGNTTYRRRM